jgi:hypothetical protein
MHGRVSGLPAFTVDASSEMEAAALALKHFIGGGEKSQLSEYKVNQEGVQRYCAQLLSRQRDRVAAAAAPAKFVQNNAPGDVAN